MSNPRVSVVMAVHNGERYLQEAIDSILSQTYRGFELLVVNDASTDATFEILENQNDSRINLLHHSEQQGLAASLNLGIDHAQGEYIARMDSDDISEPGRLQSQVSFLDQNQGYGIVGTGYSTIDEHNQVLRKKLLFADDFAIRWRCFWNPHFIHPSVMIRKSVLDDHGLRYNPEFTTTQDYDLWTRLLDHTKGYNLSDYLLRYRTHSTSVSQQKQQVQQQNRRTISLRQLQNYFPTQSIDEEFVQRCQALFEGKADTENIDPQMHIQDLNLYLNLYSLYKQERIEEADRGLQTSIACDVFSVMARFPKGQAWMILLMRLLRLEPLLIVHLLRRQFKKTKSGPVKKACQI